MGRDCCAIRALLIFVSGDIKDWRKHFDWLLVFFKHPLYIRSEGRIQMMVHRPKHMKVTAKHMFAAWRQWAIEEGLGGMVDSRFSPYPREIEY